MPPKALPEGWLPASTCFASLTAEQLKEKGLPTDEKELIELLRYIYSDGHGFMYCTGDFSDPSPVDRCVGLSDSVASGCCGPRLPAVGFVND